MALLRQIEHVRFVETLAMFDTPDLSPLCTAPFVAIIAGFFVYAVGIVVNLFIEKKGRKKRPWLIPFAMSLSIITVPIACAASVALEIGAREPAPWFQPTSGDIAGVWKLSSNTKDALQDWKVTVSEHELVFNQDGTFHVTNLPSFWGLEDSLKTGVQGNISGSGTWYLEQVEGTQRLEWVIFAQFKEFEGRFDKTLMRFYFEGHLPPYDLISLDGDILGFRFRKQ
jgi:hypothetical protein